MTDTSSPRLQWNIITDARRAAGLFVDYLVISDILSSEGHSVKSYDFWKGGPISPADRNLFLEAIIPDLFPFASENWLIPNPDFFRPDWLKQLQIFDRILCKTMDAYHIFTKLAPGKCTYIGFASRDMLISGVPRVRQFIHVSGKSRLKNTEVVIEAWRRGQPPFQLTLVTRAHSLPAERRGIRLYRHLRDEDLAVEMNRNLFHLCPSMYEGFGHILHEGLSCGNVVITTRAQPMIESGAPMELTIPVHRVLDNSQNLARLHFVRWQDVLAAVNAATAASEETVQSWRSQARDAYEKGLRNFREQFLNLLRVH